MSIEKVWCEIATPTLANHVVMDGVSYWNIYVLHSFSKENL